jgi:hypothetical protein
MALTRRAAVKLNDKKIRETDGPLALDGRRIVWSYNNQMSDGIGGRRCVGEEMRTDGTRGGWHSLADAAVKLNDEKNREMGGQLALDGRHLVKGHNNQITVDESGLRGDEEERRPGWSM